MVQILMSSHKVKKKKTTSRYGIFLGNLNTEREYTDVVNQLKNILSIELKCLEKRFAREHSHYQILSKVQKDLNVSNISQMVMNVNGGKFALSQQEVSWMRKHEIDKWLEYIIHRYHFKIYPVKHELLDFPPHLLIEPTSACNLRCVMCFQADTSFTEGKYYGMMPWALFKKLVDQAKNNGCSAITLASRGEPTLHKKFCEMLRYISDAGIMEIKINTNATKLSEEMCHAILASKVSLVVFSVDAADKDVYEKIRLKGNFEDVLNNIIRFNHIKVTSYPNAPTVTRISGVQIRDDQDLEQIYQFWSQHVDEVVMKKATNRWNTYSNPIVETQRPCSLLWGRMYVWYDGSVNPCDIDYKSKLVVGNANKSSLKEIWVNEKYKKMRMDHLEGKRSKNYPCNRCAVF